MFNLSLDRVSSGGTYWQLVPVQIFTDFVEIKVLLGTFDWCETRIRLKYYQIRDQPDLLLVTVPSNNVALSIFRPVVFRPLIRWSCTTQ